MLFDKIRDLDFHTTGFRLRPLSIETSGGWTRHATEVLLCSEDSQGVGEDISYDEADQVAFQRQHQGLSQCPGLCGHFTIEEFSVALDGIDLFPEGPTNRTNRLYRRWAFESAALDLALKQKGKDLASVLGLELGPLHFVVSLGLGSPPSLERIETIRAQNPDLRFKVDLASDWDRAFIQELGASDTVACVDLKGQYKGTFRGPDPVPEQYLAVAEEIPNAWIEDPIDHGAAWDALSPHRHRVTWDASIHAVADIEQAPVPPQCINIKPSRFGFLSELFRCYEYCMAKGIRMYGGGQFELGNGRKQIQYLASLFHADAPNDVAPGDYNLRQLPEELPTSPLPPRNFDAAFGQGHAQEGSTGEKGPLR